MYTCDFCTGDVVYQSPLTPAELLIALHNLDDKVDMKTTIKGMIIYQIWQCCSIISFIKINMRVKIGECNQH